MAATLLICLGLAPAAGAATATPLGLSQSTAFSILGASCGGIREQAFATRFDAASGHPAGAVYVQTRCGGGGRGGGGGHTYSAWVSVSWDFAGAVIAYSRLAGAPAGIDPAFSAVDARGDQLYNVLTSSNVPPSRCTVGNPAYCTFRAYLKVVVTAAATGVTAAQVGDQFRVDWVPASATAVLITSSTVTATPLRSTAPVLTATVGGSAASALIGPLQPLTTYRVAVVNTDSGGTSPASQPVTVSTPASTVVPSAPTGVSALWTAPQQPGDMLWASWPDAVPGDSPIDRYQVTVSVNDPGNPTSGLSTQTVSGSTLAVGFGVNDTLDWEVRVRAHNVAGWGPWSVPIVLAAA